MKIQLSKAQLQEIMDEQFPKILDERSHHRHNIVFRDILFEYDGKKWSTMVELHKDDGYSWEESYECYEMELKSYTYEKWCYVE